MNQPAFENEPEIRVLSVTGAVGLMVLLLALLIFIRFSQTIPQPPPIQFVEVNFGTDAIGSGRIQTDNKASDSPNAVDVKKAEKTPNRNVGSPTVTTTPRVEKTPVAPVPRVDEVKDKAKTVTEKPVIASRVESPVTVPEKAEPKKTKASPAPSPAPPGEAPPKKVETVDPNALYKRSSGGGGANGTVGKAVGTGESTRGGNNNGDDATGVGDKGNPKGNINAKEFYGTPNGGSTGVAFDVSGWSLASKPSVNDDSDETGKIVFQLTVDDAGNIIAVKTRQTTVGASVVEVYRRAVQRLKLRPKSANTPPTSTGTITFIITSK